MMPTSDTIKPGRNARSVTDDFYRLITLEAVEQTIIGRVQDNVHDFRVRVQHDGEVVLAVDAETLRSPFTTCESARLNLDRLIGRPIGDAGRPRIDIGFQCTHMFDLAVLAGVHAGRGGMRTYRIDARLRPEGSEARLERDGEPMLDWRVEGHLIVTPGLFEGLTRSGQIRWPDAVLRDPDLLEAALILRRCLLVLHGRPLSTGVQRASEMTHMAGACHTFQPGQMLRAVRPGGFEDFSSEDVLKMLAAAPR
jgi:hypothetical protein